MSMSTCMRKDVSEFIDRTNTLPFGLKLIVLSF